MLTARLDFELNIIYDRINDMIPEYEENKPRLQRHIVDLKLHKHLHRVIIYLETHAFEITHPNEKYVVSWYRKSRPDLNNFIKDGFIECADLAEVIQTIDAFLFGGFSPRRTEWWKLHEKPRCFK